MQISYHSALTKIQKLQNLKKKKKKTFFCTNRYTRYRPVLPEIGRYGQYFSGMKQGVICTSLFAGTVYIGRIGRYGIESTPLISTVKG